MAVAQNQDIAMDDDWRVAWLRWVIEGFTQAAAITTAKPTADVASIRVQQTHSLIGLKFSINALHADHQQGCSLMFKGATGSSVEMQASFWLKDMGQPTAAVAKGLVTWVEHGSASPSFE